MQLFHSTVFKKRSFWSNRGQQHSILEDLYPMRCEGRIGARKFFRAVSLGKCTTQWVVFCSRPDNYTNCNYTSFSGYREADNIRKQSMVPLLRKLHVAWFITRNNFSEVWVHERLIHRQKTEDSSFSFCVAFAAYLPIRKPGNSKTLVCPRLRGNLALLCML